MQPNGDDKGQNLRRGLRYGQAAIVILAVVDGLSCRIAAQAKSPLASTLFFTDLGLMLLLVAAGIAQEILECLGIIAKSKSRGPDMNVIVVRPPIERKTFEDRKTEDRAEPSSVSHVRGGELPAQLSHGARISWFIPPSDGDAEKPKR